MAHEGPVELAWGLRIPPTTAKDARVAKVSLHHDRLHPSHVELPVVTH